MSNTKDRIDELRRQIQADKGIARRAYDRAQELRYKAHAAELRIRQNQREIEEMGGKVRR